MLRIALFAVAMVLVSAEFADAQAPATGANPIFIDKRTVSPQRAAATDALARKTAQRGQLRVIVGLTTQLNAPHDLLPSAAAAEARVLQESQAAVTGRVLGPSGQARASNFEHIPFMTMVVNAGELGRLLADSAVASIEEDVPVPPTLSQSVPRIQGEDGFSVGFYGSGEFAVAILDTGVDKTHDMFPGGKIIREACFSSTVAGQSRSMCPGGVQSSISPGSGVNCPMSVFPCWHGTHVAGIAAGNMASPPLRGVARQARIISIQVFSRFEADFCSSGGPCALSYLSDHTKGLERVYALSKGIRIAAVNLSLGGGLFSGPCDIDNTARKAIIDLLRHARIATVIAAGNNGADGFISAPACISSAIAVGATLDIADVVADYSNHAPTVRLMAPGSNITSSVPPGRTTTNAANGTSMATPHVAGAFAVLRDAKRNALVDEISAALECTGVEVTRGGVTERRINIPAARTYLLNPPTGTTAFSFNSAAQQDQWTPSLGRWTVSGGAYRLLSSPGVGGLSTTANCQQALTVTARIKRVWREGQSNNTGIVFKAQLSDSGQRIAGYMAAINRDLPGNDHDYNVVLWRLDSLGIADGNGEAALLCKADVNTIASGRYHVIKVVSTGGIHRVFVDNVERCVARDYSYGTGRAGLIAFYGDVHAGNTLEVDSFTIGPVSGSLPPPAPAGQLAATDAPVVAGQGYGVSGQ